MRNIHFDNVGIAEIVIIPDGFQDLSFGEHLAGMLHQQVQQVELLRRQLYRATVSVNLSGRSVEGYVHMLEGATWGSAAPAQERHHPGRKLLERKGLG
jgi:hypothetical protein